MDRAHVEEAPAAAAVAAVHTGDGLQVAFRDVTLSLDESNYFKAVASAPSKSPLEDLLLGCESDDDVYQGGVVLEPEPAAQPLPPAQPFPPTAWLVKGVNGTDPELGADGMQYPDVPYETRVISKSLPTIVPVMDNIGVRLVVASLGGSDHGFNVEAASRLREKTCEMTRVEDDKVNIGPRGNYVFVKVLTKVATSDEREFKELMESMHVDFEGGQYRQFFSRSTFYNLTSRKTIGFGLKVVKTGRGIYFSFE